MVATNTIYFCKNKIMGAMSDKYLHSSTDRRYHDKTLSFQENACFRCSFFLRKVIVLEKSDRETLECHFLLMIWNRITCLTAMAMFM